MRQDSVQVKARSMWRININDRTTRHPNDVFPALLWVCLARDSFQPSIGASNFPLPSLLAQLACDVLLDQSAQKVV